MNSIEKRTTPISLDQILLNLQAIKRQNLAIQAYSAQGSMIPGSVMKVLLSNSHQVKMIDCLSLTVKRKVQKPTNLN